MTDTFGSEPHDQESGHDEVLTPEPETVHEAPSEDEFADHHGDDHGAAVAEEHSEEHSDDMGAAPVDEPARRSPLLPIIAAVFWVMSALSRAGVLRAGERSFSTLINAG